MTILKVDYETSTVEFGGRRFPCCGLVCPIHETAPEMSEGERALGGPSGPGILNQLSFQCCIPLENGVYVLLDCDEGNETFNSVHLVVDTCIETRLTNGERDWLPIMLRLYGKRLEPEMDRRRIHRPLQSSMWSNADPEWVVELIDRVGALHLPDNLPDNPKAVPVTLPELLRMWSVVTPGYLDA